MFFRARNPKTGWRIAGPRWPAIEKSLYSANQEQLQSLLRALRVAAKMRQQDLADALGEPQSFVSEIENGERRLDVLELREVCRALGLSSP